MKAHGIRLILGLIAATVIAADEQGFHLHGVNKADNQGFGALMGKPARGAHQRSLRRFRLALPTWTLTARRWFANVRRSQERGCCRRVG
jgi:hypothetical protein